MRRPLEGVRIIDFTWAWAGPYAVMLLALLGAEVIKIETRKRLDHSRLRSLASGPNVGGPDEAPIFNELNLNKMSLTLDLSKPEAVEIVKKLVKISDVVVQNFRPGVLDRLGLGYNVLKEIKPDLVMLSSSAQGTTGPERHYIGFAPTFSSLGGLAYLTGFPEGPPIPLMGSSDLRSATTSAFAILAALYERAQSGQGQHIDLASTETIGVLVGDAIMDYTMNQKIPTRKGNRHEFMAPHNYYPCRGENRWVSIAVSCEEEWESLCKVMGSPPWAREKRFSDAAGRWENQDELDGLIKDWTVNYTNTEITERLQEAGVAASPVYGCEELYTDPHLQARGFSELIEHPIMGKVKVVGPPWKLSDTPARITRHGPLLGEHNEYILKELLDFSQGEITKLKDNGILY